MNDRMTELYAKACLDARDIHPTDVPAFIACMAEKFAELIVKECEVALKPPVQVRDVISRGQAYNLIKQHFGVEE